MKRIASLLCLLVLLVTPKGFANYCDPCFRWCDLSVSLYADYLYWKVTKPDNDIQFSSISPLGTFAVFAVPNYSSGFRIGGALCYDCFDFEVRYTVLKNRLGPASLTTDLVELLGIQYHIHYRTVDLAFGYTRFFHCYRGSVRPYLGAKLAWLHEQTSSSSQNLGTITFTDLNLNTRAFGPMFGVESRWEIFRCGFPVFLIGRGDLSVLNATTYYSNFITSNASTNPYLFPNALSLFPFVADFYIGVGFDLCNFSCFAANFQVGYEAQAWMMMPESDVGFLDSLGLGGLVVRGNITF